MTEIRDSQFTILPDGRVGFQPDPTNPLPGGAFARLEKGEAPLRPRLEILPDQTIPEGLPERAGQWLQTRIVTVLEPLVLLDKAQDLSPALAAVAQAILSGFGTAARADLRTHLAALSPQDRQILRARKIRPGSLHVYFQDMNKPGAVRLRALLWALWHGAPVPPPLPHDGAVSAVRPEGAPDVFGPSYWLAVGYPLCAGRLVRIDMLDRLVGAVYDIAEKGIFRATHQMAEWLGVPIETLYVVLDSLGHKRIPDPVAVPSVASQDSVTDVLPESVPDESPVATEPEAPVPVVSGEEEGEKTPETKPEIKKPQLALFRLARVHTPHPPPRGQAGPPRDRSDPPAPGGDGKSDTSPRYHRKGKAREGSSEESQDSRRSFQKTSQKPGRSEKPGGQTQGTRRPFDRDRADRSSGKGDFACAERPERVIRAEAKINPDDSPFAVLRQLVQTKPSESSEGG